MSKRHQPAWAAPQPTMMSIDPAHAPGKQHIARDFRATELHKIDRQQHQQRMPSSAPSIRNRRTERGR